MRKSFGFALAALCALCCASMPALALDPYDAPVVSCVSSGENSITIKICAAAAGTGAPAGVSVHWKTLEDWEANGWADGPGLCELSLSGQPSLQHPGASRWELLAGECEEILIGDINFDETGVSGHGCGLDGLECGTTYVFRSFAHAGRRMGRSDWSTEVFCTTADCPAEECTFTQGYWKTHGPTDCQTGMNSNEWPVSSLTLGNVAYDQADLCCILNKPAGGNGLVALAHQLIAAKLNMASGASCSAATAAVAAADALIGNLVVPSSPAGCTGGGGSLSPSSTSGLTMTLDQFNNGVLSGCPAHCPSPNSPTGVEEAPWGKVKSYYR